MSTSARLLFPALRWDPGREAYGHRGARERALRLGVGGFILYGGTAEAARELTAELRAGSPHPLLIAADLERGAGQQFRGGTRLPPAAALAELDDTDVTRRAGELTAREALAMGVNWIYAPVADLDLEPANPIVGSRAFGSEPERAARHVAAWVRGCGEGGALPCAKHFPGHGRTRTDSHLALPLVPASADELEADLGPFIAAIEAGVESVMTAHVAYPALDPERRPATLSRPILTRLLRERLGFEGLIVTDALVMKGVLSSGGEAEAAVRAVAAGCDAILHPGDPEAVLDALDAARGRAYGDDRLREAEGRVRVQAERLAERTEERATDREATRLWGRNGDAEWSVGLAGRAVRLVRGHPRLPAAVELVTVDDDLVGSAPARADRGAFPQALRELGLDVREVARPTGGAAVIVALYADVQGHKGRPGLSEAAVRTVSSLITAPRGATVVLFGHPRTAVETPGANLLVAWGGDTLMQRAAARSLASYATSSS